MRGARQSQSLDLRDEGEAKAVLVSEEDTPAQAMGFKGIRREKSTTLIIATYVVELIERLAGACSVLQCD